MKVNHANRWLTGENSLLLHCVTQCLEIVLLWWTSWKILILIDEIRDPWRKPLQGIGIKQLFRFVLAFGYVNYKRECIHVLHVCTSLQLSVSNKICLRRNRWIYPFPRCGHVMNNDVIFKCGKAWRERFYKEIKICLCCQVNWCFKEKISYIHNGSHKIHWEIIYIFGYYAIQPLW